MRKKNVRSSILFAIILGLVYPYLFGRLAALFVPGRDELPRMDNLLGVAGCLGLGIFTLPGMIVTFGLVFLLNALNDMGYTIPLFNSLSDTAQMNCLWGIGLISNVLFWLAVVTMVQFLKSQRALPGQNEPSNPVTSD